MLRSDVLRKMAELKRRASNRKQSLPSVKLEKDVQIENKNFIDLKSHIYLVI